MTIKDLEPGDWVNMAYGYYRHDFYVLRVLQDKYVVLGKPTWCVDTTVIKSYEELNSDYYTPIFIGKGKEKWYWRFLPWRNVIVPFKYPDN